MSGNSSYAKITIFIGAAILLLVVGQNYASRAFPPQAVATSTADSAETSSAPAGCGGCVGLDDNGRVIRVSETSRITLELPAATYDKAALVISPSGSMGETFGASARPGDWVRTFEAVKPGTSTIAVPGANGRDFALTVVIGESPERGAQTFSSAALGLSFKYDADFASVTEAGKTVEVYQNGTDPSKGQRVERFEKRANETFEQSIRRQVLAGYSSSSCEVAIEQTNKYRGGYQEAEITYPPPRDPAQPFWANAAACNQAYDKANGIRFFLYDANHPDRFYFFDIGQYAIPASGVEPWQDTVTIN